MNNRFKIKQMTGVAVLSAIVIVLQLISNYVKFGPVSITLALTPVIVGAIIYGTKTGFILGALQGLLVFTNPDTLSFFAPITYFGTLFICIIKTGIAGLVAGMLYKLIHNKNNKVAVFAASLATPIVNTAIFTIGSFTIFYNAILNLGNSLGYANFMYFFFIIFIGYNFLIELAVNTLLAPAVLRIINIYKDKFTK